MQIIIPMSGFGERFRKVGYKVPKPLIEVEGKPIIHHVIDMFPAETNFIFICNEDHLKNADFNMESTILDYCPSGKVVSIESHKLGPVHAVLQIAEMIDDCDDVIVNYCDFTCYWDWHRFKEFISKKNLMGCVPAYKGFHPHSLGTTNYAYIKETNLLVEDIQEKQPYTSNRMEEYASSGTYYFRSGKLMLDAFKYVVENNLNTADEFYVSLAYKYLIKYNHKIYTYPLQHFMQWGTPDDVEEYNNWSTIFKKLIHKTHSLVHKGIRIIPMAGLGKRFSEEGYTTTKSLLSVSGMPMVAQALNDLPKTDSNIFIIRNNMDDQDQIIEYLNTNFTDSKILSVPGVTEGQACTAQFGVRGLNDDEGPLIFGACDNGVIYDQDHLKDTLNEDYDVIVWGVRNHINACRNPNSYGWIECDNLNNITSVSVKKPINSEYNNPVILGTFIFRNAQTFNDIVDDLISSGKRVNGEFYLDSAVNTAIDKCLNVKFFEVDHFLCWGTPDELKTFEYWQSCFSKWQSHPYELAKDKMIPENMVDEIAHEYKKFSF